MRKFLLLAAATLLATASGCLGPSSCSHWRPGHYLFGGNHQAECCQPAYQQPYQMSAPVVSEGCCN